MKKILLIIPLALLLTSCASRQVNIEQLEIKDGIAYANVENKPYSGDVNWYFPNGQIKAKVTVVNGFAEGQTREWYENGQLGLDGYKVNDQWQGLRLNWFENGQLLAKTIYINGLEEGLVSWWFENGQLKGQYNAVNGKEEGLYKEWYANGQLMIETLHVDGKKQGLSRNWFENGQLMGQGSYVKGKEEGLFRFWHENGQLRLEENWVNGKREGLERSWLEDGQFESEKTYVDDELIENLLDIIQAQNQLYMDAYRSDNADAIVALHTQDATVIAPKFEPAKGHDEIRSGLIEELALGDGILELQTIEVTRMNQNTAYEIGQYKLHIDLLDGEAIEEEGNTLLIWKLSEDKIWRIHVDMWNSNHLDH